MASTSRLTVWLALAACAGVQAWVCPTRPVELTRVPTPLMKGRKQGDGPAKSSRKSKKTPVPLLQRAKVEAAKKRRAKAESALTPTLVASAQGERFVSMCRSGASAHAVFARAIVGAAGRDGSIGDGKWMRVGDVCVGAAGSEVGMDVVSAAQLQRRLVYEQALRLYPLLAMYHREEVQIGLVGADAGEPVPLPEFDLNGEEIEAPGGLEAMEDGQAASGRGLAPLLNSGGLMTARKRKELATQLLGRAAMVGFAGDDLPSGIYRWAASEGANLGAGKKDWANSRNKLGNDSKSAVAQQFHETLGLRGS